MNATFFHQTRLVCIAMTILTIYTIPSFGQIGLKSPLYQASIDSGTAGITFPKPVLPLRDWLNPKNNFIDFKSKTKSLEINKIISSEIIQNNPFTLDTRSTSYYVPRMVRDELNLIMNRPRDNAFVPILPVAFLALQLVRKYVLIRQKTEITAEDIENSREGLPILKELWRNSPQTLSQLYQHDILKEKYTMLELKRLIDILADNKLVKPKLIKNSETQYFYAIGKDQYSHIIEQEKARAVKSEAELMPTPLK